MRIIIALLLLYLNLSIIESHAVEKPTNEIVEISFSSPEVVSIVQKSNQVELNSAKSALKLAKNQSVREYAKMVIDDRTGIVDELKSIQKTHKLKAKENYLSSAIESEANEQFNRLKNLNGNGFDREYIGHSVLNHQSVLDLLDSRMILSTHHEVLKSFLQKFRMIVQSHLDHALNIQSTLKTLADNKSYIPRIL